MPNNRHKFEVRFSSSNVASVVYKEKSLRIEISKFDFASVQAFSKMMTDFRDSFQKIHHCKVTSCVLQATAASKTCSKLWKS